ncbi:hypothetical protein [Aurantiacibacter rhizosphaerae]|uniref:Uncharacterized protein n=1 Tax=Aurantiacibacter rhizosphaerae TaxID=2691582 RepID=A0A844XA46_9SPHN|nr:hypothetical protein [Aurantiacibacter rhizosphaerae]MWV27321.1 hypothetical protein [Aurantiacibacter rhizosphaerae]
MTIKSAFRRLSKSHTAKLLVLEFIVVLSGVLAAQLLQGWFAEREERARAQNQIEGIATALHNSAELAVMRQRMNLCMIDRIETLRDALAAPQIDQDSLTWVRVPEQNLLDDPGIEAARPLITKAFGPETMIPFNLVEFVYENMYIAQDAELAAWSKLSLLNPENGPVGPDLRGEMQLALAEARKSNRLMIEVSGMMRNYSRQLGTPVHEHTIEGFATSPKLCAAMVAYSDDEHAAAAERGELPDGTQVHPRALERVASGIR